MVTCQFHAEYDKDCRHCRIARLVQLDATEPHPYHGRVPRNVCRCPIMQVGDFCPVHGG